MTEIADIKRRLSALAEGVLEGAINRADAAVVSQIFNVHLRAVSVELKAREQEELVGRLEELEEALERRREDRRYGAS
jgi:proteasome assembly chaperone (PAC2) family protein